MSRTYTQSNLNEGFHIQTGMPIDDRLVVNSLSDLFNWDEETFEYLYLGMVVAVVKNDSSGAPSWTDPDNGLYYITRTGPISGGGGFYYNCIFDPTVENDILPDTVNRIPGRSKNGGWRKLVTVDEMNFPTQPGNYILTITNEGNVEWTIYQPGSTLPTPDDVNVYLKAVPGEDYDQDPTDIDIIWAPVGGGSDFPAPSSNGKKVLQVLDYTDPNTWTWVDSESGSGIDIIGYPGENDAPDQEGRWSPGSDTVHKNKMSNSGEVIAVPVDDDPSEEGPDRPFKLMLNYDQIPPLTINGGDSTPDPVRCVFTAYYYIQGQSKPAFTDPRSGNIGDTFTYTPISRRTIGNVTYVLNGQATPVTVTLTGDPSVDKREYIVTAEANWNPVVKYAIQASFSSYDWDSKGQSNSPTELVETCPQGAASEDAGTNAKYFYAPSGNLPVMQLNAVTCRLHITDSNYITDLARIDMWDQANGQWVELTQNTPITLTKTQRTIPSAVPSVSEWDILAHKDGTDQNTPITLTYRFKITRQ